MEWFKRAWRAAKASAEAHGFFTSDLFKITVWPLASAAVTALSGLLGAVPLPYVFAAASFVFAAVATGLLRLDEWRERTDASGKVAFDQPTVGIDADLESEPPRLNAVQIGLQIKNNGSFALSYEVESIEVQFMGRVAEEKSYFSRGGEVSPHTAATFRDPAVPIGVDMPTGTEAGRLKFKLAYWRTPKRKFFVERIIRIAVRFQPERKQIGVDWFYE